MKSPSTHHPGHKNKSEEDAEHLKEYKVHVRCENCGFSSRLWIPKGVNVSMSVCPNCECYDLVLA